MTSLCGWSQNLVSAEYYWDNDPGIGNATSLNVGTPGTTINESFTISTNGLSHGEHLLCIRTMNDQGEWSTIESKAVHIHKYTSAEYFWDEDPGTGNGNSLVLNSNNAEITTNFNISTVNIREGWHTLFTRVRGLADTWSVAQPYAVFIENKIVAAEYFWNYDPGVANGTALDVGSPSSDITFTDDVTTVGLDTTQDIHYLVGRTMAQNGAWSVFLDTLINLGPVSVEDFVFADMHNNLFPNPASGLTTLSLFSVYSKNISITMENISGETVQQVFKGIVSGRKDIQLDVSPLSAGIYVMHYVMDNQHWTTKLIVQ